MMFGLSSRDTLLIGIIIGIVYSILTVITQSNEGTKWGGYLIGVALFALITVVAIYMSLYYGLILPGIGFLIYAQRTYFVNQSSSPGDDFVGLLAVTAVAIPAIVIIGVVEYYVESLLGIYPVIR